MVAHATYSKALITKGYGHPLWKPDPGECGPVEIADVGYISNGGFTRLFSTSTKSDLSNRHGLPEGHRPLTVGDIRYQTPLPKQPEYISSEGVQRKGTNITISAGPSVQEDDISFECIKQNGAVLVMGDVAYRQDAVDLGRFYEHIVGNHCSWLAFANERLGRGLSLTDLILVTGCDRTSDWACGAWSDSSHSESVSFVIEQPSLLRDRAGTWGRWKGSDSFDRNSGPQRLGSQFAISVTSRSLPSDATPDRPPGLQVSSHVLPQDPPPNSNQCVFVRGFRIGDRNTWFTRKTNTSMGDGFVTVAKPLDWKQEGRESGHPQGSTRAIDIHTPSGAGGWDTSISDGGVDVKCPEDDKRSTPSEAMIGFILENSTADLALIHDDDFGDLVQRSSDTIIKDYYVWIRELAPVVYLDTGDVGMFRGTYMSRNLLNDRKTNVILPLLTRDKEVLVKDTRATRIAPSTARTTTNVVIPIQGLPPSGDRERSSASDREILAWTGKDPRKSQLFNSEGLLYQFQTGVGLDGLSITTLLRTRREDRPEPVARLNWAANGGLGHIEFGKNYVSMPDFIRNNSDINGARMYTAPDGLRYCWVPGGSSREILLRDPNNNVVALFRPTRPTKYQFGDVHGELHFFPCVGACTIMHPPIMDFVTVTAMLFRFCSMYGGQRSSNSARTTSQAVVHRGPKASLCRAIYDYTGTDASSLSFRKNDILKVIDRTNSGWCDGFLGEKRGWFPSSYVTIPDSGVEEPHPALQPSLTTQPCPSDYGDEANLNGGLDGINDCEEHWLDGGVTRSPSSNNNMLKSDSYETMAESGDFWLPQVTEEGQIFYLNTHTGMKSRDLPQEIGNGIIDTEYALLSSLQTISHSGPKVLDHALGTEADITLTNEQPSATMSTRPASEPVVASNITVPPARQRSVPAGSVIRPLPRITATNRATDVHCDDSDIYPTDRERSLSLSSVEGSASIDRDPIPHRTQSSPKEDVDKMPELEITEHLAQLLQKALTPPPAELLEDMSEHARDTVRELLNRIVLDHTPPLPYEAMMDGLVRSIVLAVRDFLYVASVPPPQIPSDLLPRTTGEHMHTTAPQDLLKTPQRKVTATLAKLVLSARALRYNSGSTTLNTYSRIKENAEELDRYILAFVQEMQRCKQMQGHKVARIRRLRGHFPTVNIGLGLVGAGVGASWKGLGWVVPDETEEPPGKILDAEAVTELNTFAEQVQRKVAALRAAIGVSTLNRLLQASRDLVGQMSSLLVCCANIHVARHVDIDGMGRKLANAPNDDPYLQTVNNARLLVRTLEAAMQSLYDDGSTLVLKTQCMHFSPSHEYSSESRDLDVIGASLQRNLDVVCKTYEALLGAGYDQADLSQGEYNGSIRWRMSRLSVTPTQSDRTYRPGSGISVVTMSFDPPSVKQKGSISSLDDRLVLNDPQMESTPADTLSNQDAKYLDDPHLPESKSPRPGIAGEKLEELLDQEAPFIDTVNLDSKPWYLLPSYGQTDILIDPDGSVKGGTVPALVERLTAHEHGDPTFIKTFLMTYKSFTTLDELFNLLVQRFWIQPPGDLKTKELEEWARLKQHIIQLRVLNTFKTMIQDEDILEKEDMYILGRMSEFLKKKEVNQLPAAKGLLTLIERSNSDAKVKVTVTTSQTPPLPIQPKTSKQLTLLDIDPLELARQLTMMESRLYQSIKSMECLQRSREARTEYKDNIANVTQNFNRLAIWIQGCVLEKENMKKRAAVIKYFISVADKCRSLHNYSSMVAIISGLNAVPVRRLKRTWEQVNGRFLGQLNTCEAIIDPNRNFMNYRKLLAEISPPCIPYIGVFLTALTFVQEGSMDSLSNNLVNFRKRQKAAEVIHDIKRWQSQPHYFHSITSVLVFIEDSLNRFSDQKDIGEMFWNLSNLLEPREREDETITRLMQESGFLQ